MTGSIVVHPNVILRVQWYFYSLYIGNIINLYIYIPLPIPQEVSERIHILTQYSPTVYHFLVFMVTPLLNTTMNERMNTLKICTMSFALQ